MANTSTVGGAGFGASCSHPVKKNDAIGRSEEIAAEETIRENREIIRENSEPLVLCDFNMTKVYARGTPNVKRRRHF
jgi:hypothetical protein